MIKIQPISIQLDWFKITNVSINLNHGAFVSYSITDNQQLAITGQLEMDQESYDNWGSDDSYVTSWALAQLGLQPAK